MSFRFPYPRLEHISFFRTSIVRKVGSILFDPLLLQISILESISVHVLLVAFHQEEWIVFIKVLNSDLYCTRFFDYELTLRGFL